MSIEIKQVNVLDNPATFSTPFKFEITFDCLAPGVKEELEWKLIYVGCADDDNCDQELDSVLVGPVQVGKNRFVFQAPCPDASKIPEKDLLDVTVLLLTCSYKSNEFIRVGYYVMNEYPGYNNDSGMALPSPIDIQKIKRNILANKPRVTRFHINWDCDDDTNNIINNNNNDKNDKNNDNDKNTNNNNNEKNGNSNKNDNNNGNNNNNNNNDNNNENDEKYSNNEFNSMLNERDYRVAQEYEEKYRNSNDNDNDNDNNNENENNIPDDDGIDENEDEQEQEEENNNHVNNNTNKQNNDNENNNDNDNGNDDDDDDDDMEMIS